MKINISGLMSLVSEYEKKLNSLSNLINQNLYSVSIQELNGKTNLIEDTKEEFSENFNEYNDLLRKITELKTVLYEKNNSLKLSDGRTIQTAIIDNTNLRKQKTMYENILCFNSSKRRVTEVNNSYFECRTINYDRKEVKANLEKIVDKIQKTDFEISKLNSIEFEVKI